ncbi:methyltransferase family protein [Flavobacterium sp.]|uniref:methyltransferase family protein n=1 Tax=Flavobacterium sp. TaxID=239 RepID=UPI0038D041CE
MNLFNWVCLIWISSEILINSFLRSNNSDKQSADKNSWLIIWCQIIASNIISVYLSANTDFLIVNSKWISVIGLVLMLFGIGFRLLAIKQLGRFFTVKVTIREDHQLMQSGLYKYMRHPSYTGSLITFFSFGLALNNWPSLAIVFFPTVYTMLYRIRVEEKVLMEQFGGKYITYSNKTKRLIPFIY